MSSDSTYNIVVVGGGAAGLVSAYLAAAAKAKVALVCDGPMGGDCLNTGCVPSKALLRSAKVAKELKSAAEFGFKNVSYEVDFEAVMARVAAKIKAIEPNDSRERYESLGVDCYDGRVVKLAKNVVKLSDDTTLETKNIIIATGARAFVPPIKGLTGVDFLTNENVWKLKQLPKKLVMIGAGAIGCELAQAFARLGTNVTLLEQSKHLFKDGTVTAELGASLMNDGVKVMLGASVREITPGIVHLENSNTQIEFSHVFVATGRRAVSDLAEPHFNGINLNDDGSIKVNEYLEANGDGIYACGDVLGKYQLTHAASHEAYYCVLNALGRPFVRQKVDYSVIPSVVYTDPEIARIGASEADLEDFEKYQFDFKDLDRAIVDSNTAGYVKVLVKPGSDKILGVQIVGTNAGELIAEWALAMKAGLSLNQILGTVHAYPTMAEASQRVAGQWRKENTGGRLLTIAEKINAWRR